MSTLDAVWGVAAGITKSIGTPQVTMPSTASHFAFQGGSKEKWRSILNTPELSVIEGPPGVALVGTLPERTTASTIPSTSDLRFMRSPPDSTPDPLSKFELSSFEYVPGNLSRVPE